MRKILMAGLFLSCAGTTFAQIIPKIAADTTLKQDTTILQDIKGDALDNVPVVSLDDDASDVGTEGASASFNRGYDPFNTAANFNFSPVRFRRRGYESNSSETYMNGAPMEDLTSGYSATGLWSGLSAETRSRYITLGMHSNPFTFGGVGNSTFIDSRASRQRKQTSITLSGSDAFIKSGLAITYNTGLSKKGWALSLSGNRRYSDNGYAPGTYYNSWSYFVGLDKKFKNQTFSLVAFAAPTESGAQGHATKEAFDLAGTNYYNPYWGYQAGKVRNSHVTKSNQPTFILSHEYAIHKNASLLTAVSYTFGERSSSRIDYFNAPNPAPDYYTNMPSYYTITSPAIRDSLTAFYKSHPEALQLNWQNIYNVNRGSNATIQNAGGVPGQTVTGHRSLYVLGDNVTNTKRLNFTTTLNSAVSKNVTLTGGLSFQAQRNNYFKRVADLLGGDFWVDVDQYAVQDFPGDPTSSQNDLNHPNRTVRVGDKYGYNYDINVNEATVWVQTAMHYKKADFFVATQLSNTDFWRVGNYRNGLFPDSSYGSSKINEFVNYAVKAGGTYKIAQGNFVYLNALVSTKAPYFKDAYYDAEIKNTTQTNLQNQDIRSIEGGYILNSPSVSMRLSGYYSTFRNGFNLRRYFDYSLNEFVDFALSNVNTVQFGGELGAEVKLAKGLTATGAASVGRYYYDTRQLVTVSQDNTNAAYPGIPPGTLVYIQNYRVPNTPQESYSLGLNYRSSQFWGVSLTSNYFDQMWVDPLPDRRTYSAVHGLNNNVDPKSPLWGSVLDQEKYPAEFLMNFSAWKSWKIGNIIGIKKSYILSLSAGANNILNNQNVISNGYEGGRDYKFPTGTGVFPTKYTYADGITYYVRATLRFY